MPQNCETCVCVGETTGGRLSPTVYYEVRSLNFRTPLTSLTRCLPVICLFVYGHFILMSSFRYTMTYKLSLDRCNFPIGWFWQGAEL